MVISKKSLQFLLVTFVACIPLANFANPTADSLQNQTENVNPDVAHQEADSSKEKEFNATDLINSHIGDSHDFHIADWNGHAVSMPLPIILWTNNGLEVFSSSLFHHDNTGTHEVEVNGQKFVKHNEIIYYADKFKNLSEDDKSAFNFEARPLNFSITKLVFSMFLSVIVLFLLFTSLARSYKYNEMAPKGMAGFLEPLVIFVRDDIAIPNIGEKKYAKFMPYLLTVFFFVWINNLIGLVPFFPFSANLTGNIYFTFVLALITFIITILNANKNYWGHIFSPPVPKALYPIMWPVEIIGMFTKPFALMIRLFANITAGHIIILSLFSLIYIFETAWISPVSGAFVLFMSFLEMLVAALQAYVFTLLSALFIGQAVEEHDHH